MIEARPLPLMPLLLTALLFQVPLFLEAILLVASGVAPRVPYLFATSSGPEPAHSTDSYWGASTSTSTERLAASALVASSRQCLRPHGPPRCVRVGNCRGRGAWISLAPEHNDSGNFYSPISRTAYSVQTYSIEEWVDKSRPLSVLERAHSASSSVIVAEVAGSSTAAASAGLGILMGALSSCPSLISLASHRLHLELVRLQLYFIVL